jgi:nicotinamide mononucleotide (NMN) deamidase PncC
MSDEERLEKLRESVGKDAREVSQLLAENASSLVCVERYSDGEVFQSLLHAGASPAGLKEVELFADEEACSKLGISPILLRKARRTTKYETSRFATHCVEEMAERGQRLADTELALATFAYFYPEMNPNEVYECSIHVALANRSGKVLFTAAVYRTDHSWMKLVSVANALRLVRGVLDPDQRGLLQPCNQVEEINDFFN